MGIMTEVAPVFRDTDNGYSYSVCGYMNVEMQDANIEVMERDLAQILRLRGEQEKLWKAYEDWKGR